MWTRNYACLPHENRKTAKERRLEVRNEIQAFHHTIKKDYLLHVPITRISDT